MCGGDLSLSLCTLPPPKSKTDQGTRAVVLSQVQRGHARAKRKRIIWGFISVTVLTKK